MPNKPNTKDWLLKYYTQPNKTNPLGLIWDKQITSAYHLIQKANVINNLSIIIKVEELLESAPNKTIKDNHFSNILDLSNRTSKLYDNAIDDVIIMGTFEIYIKACLLKEGYVIHTIKGDNQLHKKQGNEPVKFNELHSKTNINDENTLKCSSLLTNNYFNINPLNDEHLEAFKDISNSRNQIHFRGSNICKIGGKLKHLYAIQNLFNKINEDYNHLNNEIKNRTIR